MEQRTDDGLPYHVFSRAEWAALREDTPMTLDARRGDAAALAARPARHGGDRGHLPAAVAPAVALRRRDPAAVPGPAALPRHRGRQDALRHRRRRLGRGRQVDHGARAPGAAGALAQRAQGRSRHHRRLPLSQRGARARRPDGDARAFRKATTCRRCCASCPTSRPGGVRCGRRSIRISSTT